MNRGIVYLIGAGPGDVKLITLKGLECIRKADVIVYDRLANPRLLRYRRPDARLIYVGKSPERHTLRQEEINRILVEEGLAGNVVARLKGGDPYVFGRGGEEGEALRAAGVRFEEVPGITSAIAVPAYAGIPLTHRDFTSTFTVITGHEEPGKAQSGIDWPRLAQDPGTLVFLMGVGNLAEIAGRLLEYGKDAGTPAAVIRWGTRPEQQVVTGTLDTIAGEVARAGLRSPAIILVGRVVALRETLCWFEEKPLFGKRVLVTRAREQASVLSEKLEELGAEAWEYPVIRIAEPEDTAALDRAVAEAGRYDWILFTSANGVDAFFRSMRAQRLDVRTLGRVRLCAIGPRTAQSLEERGLLVDVMPEVFRAEAVAEALGGRVRAGERVLLPRADLARPVLAESLRAMGARVDEVIAYRTLPADETDTGLLLEKLRAGEIHVVTFTSSSTVTNFLRLLGEDRTCLSGVTVACIGPVTAETARANGLPVDIVAERYTIDGLVDAIEAHFAARPPGARMQSSSKDRTLARSQGVPGAEPGELF